MNLVPPYDVMCLHRRISTSWLFSSLFCFSPPTRIPRGLRAGGLVVGRSCLLVGAAASTVSSKAAANCCTRCGFAAVDGYTVGKPGGGGQQAGLTGRGPLGRGELNAVTVQWTGWVEKCLFWMPIKITIWKRPCFCSVCGEASLLCWMSQVLSLIGTRGERDRP